MNVSDLRTALEGQLQRGLLQQDFSQAQATDVQQLPYGNCASAGALPSGYDPSAKSNSMLLHQDPLNTASSIHDRALLVTTIPISAIDDELKDHPDNWAECLLTAYVKRMIYSTKGFPRPLNRPAVPAYKIAAVKGKGLGMVATRRIEAGEMVCDERPLLVVPAVITPLTSPDLSYIKNATREEIIQAKLTEYEKTMVILVDRMPKENQDAYRALSNCHQHDGSGPLTGILRTNGFSLADDIRDKGTTPGERIGKYSGVWNDISRINHSCSPNTGRNWSTPSFSMKFRAVRVIEEGEEITCDYLGDLLHPTKHRQDILAPYGFSCSCKACLTPEITDGRRLTYLAWLGRTHHFVGRSCTIEESIAVLDSMTEDGLEGNFCYHSILTDLTTRYMALGDEVNALRYGKRLYTAKVATGKGKAYKQFASLEAMKKDERWNKK